MYISIIMYSAIDKYDIVSVSVSFFHHNNYVLVSLSLYARYNSGLGLYFVFLKFKPPAVTL